MSSSNSGRLMATQSIRLIVILGICGALSVAALDDRLGDYSFHFHHLVFHRLVIHLLVFYRLLKLY